MRPIIIGADHAGLAAKASIKRSLEKKGLEVIDVGTFGEQPVDYPAIAKKVAERVKQKRTLGILICGSGTGMQIAANKIDGIRAAFCYDVYSATMARAHNDANILTLRARRFPRRALAPIVEAFLTTPFSGEQRHQRRIRAISRLER